MMRDTILNRIEQEKVIAILRGLEPKEVLSTVRAMAQGGVTLAEVPFNQGKPATFSKTLESIRLVKEILGDSVVIGAGTVLTPEQVDLAAEAGAGFIVSPDADRAVIERTRERGLVSIPGAYTPTEAKNAWNWGGDFIKVFPCMSPEYMKLISVPLNQIRFLAVGGVTPETAGAYLEAGATGVAVGGSLADIAWIREGRYQRVTQQARAFRDAVK